MSSSLAPQVLVYKADAAISKGMGVKPGTDNQHVAKSVSATSLNFGIAQSAPTTAEDLVEVAVKGGCKGLAAGVIAVGDLITVDSTGGLIATTTPGDRYFGMSLQIAAVGDLFEVLLGQGLI